MTPNKSEPDRKEVHQSGAGFIDNIDYNDRYSHYTSFTNKLILLLHKTLNFFSCEDSFTSPNVCMWSIQNSASFQGYQWFPKVAKDYQEKLRADP